MAAKFQVVRTPAFDSVAQDYVADGHNKLEEDLIWLIGRLAQAPDLMGDHVPELKNLALPVFKTRLKDSCHKIGASGGWRIYYAINKDAAKVFLLVLHHKKEYENPNKNFSCKKWRRHLPSGKRRPDNYGMAKILYHAVPGDWRKEQKYAFLEKSNSVAGVKWTRLTPDKRGNWITNDTDEEFAAFLPIGSKDAKAGMSVPTVCRR